MVNPTTNAITWSWWLLGDTFGSTTPAAAGITLNLRFPGQYYDSETGLNYNYFRDYEPGTGRYVESDPLGLPGGLNTYSYTGANTLRYMDPVGLTCMTNWVFFWDWWFERGATSRKYGDGDTENQEMQSSPPAQYMRERFKAGGCKNIQLAGYGTIRAYFETFTQPCGTQFQVGGFVWSAINVGDCKVRYHVNNTASLFSFFFHIPGLPHKDRGGSFPYGGNIVQDFYWTEPSPCGGCCAQ